MSFQHSRLDAGPNTYRSEVRQRRRQDQAVLATGVLAEQIDPRRRTFGRRSRLTEHRREQVAYAKVRLHDAKIRFGSGQMQAEQKEAEQLHSE